MHFNKISLAVAIGSILAAPAAVAQSTVQIYGKLYPYFLDEKGTNATAPGTPVSSLAATPTGVNGSDHVRGFQSGNSRLGFRGSEDLGGGLKAIFQLESQLSVDDGSGAGVGGGLQFNRPTFVGLDSQYGTLQLGVLDTIFKTYGDTIGFLGVSSGTFMSTSSVLRKTGFGTSSASSFHLRKGNTIQYETPQMSGFTVGLMYQTDEAKVGNRDPHMVSMGVKWDNGPFYVALAHERHYDIFGGSANAPTAQRNNGATDTTNSKDVATEFVVEWRPIKDHRIEFDAVSKKYDENATVTGRFSNYKNMAYLLAWEAKWTEQWRTSAYYVTSGAGTCTRVGAVCTTDGLDGRKVQVGAAYYLSKRTYLFTAASRLTNGKSARYTSNDYAGRPNPGEDITQFALGVSHSF